MKSLLGNEISKTFRKWRSSISFLALAVVVPLVHFAFWWQRDRFLDIYARGLTQDFMVFGNLLNAYFVTAFLMNSLLVHIPFLITLGAGDQLAGEATGGTLRILLTRPASRTNIVMAKYATALLYSLALVFFLVTLSLLVGIVMLGTGPLLVPGQTIVILSAAEAPVRLALATALAIWAMSTVASLAFLLSSLVDNAIGPIIGTMAVIIVLLVVSTLPVDLFAEIRPSLFTTYMNVWQQALVQPIDWREIARSVLILGGYSIGFFLSAWYIFARKDILS
jgi:ABC-2 type transport system permease protein